MTSRLDDDDLDTRWRDGLQAAVPFVDGRNAPQHVAARVTRRRRRRRSGIALIAATITILLTAGGTLLLTRGDTQPSIRVAGRTPDSGDVAGPVTQLHVTSEPDLTMHLDRATVPAGVVEIVYLDGGGTHELRIDRAPSFRLRVPLGPSIRRVRLVPGRYVLYCDLPGHRPAGEQAVLTVVNAKAAATTTKWLLTDAEMAARPKPPNSPTPAPPSRDYPATQANTANTRALADLVTPKVPASVRKTNETEMVNGPAMVTFTFPSGRTVFVARQKLTTPLSLFLMGYRPEMGDTYTRLSSGSELLVIRHIEPYTKQVIMVRPNGTLLNLRVESPDRLTSPPEVTLDQLVGIAAALDTSQTDI